MKISVWCGNVWTEARLNHGVIDGPVGRPPLANWSSYWRKPKPMSCLTCTLPSAWPSMRPRYAPAAVSPAILSRHSSRRKSRWKALANGTRAQSPSARCTLYWILALSISARIWSLLDHPAWARPIRPLALARRPLGRS